MDRSLLEFRAARTAGKVILAFTGGYRRLWVNPLMSAAAWMKLPRDCKGPGHRHLLHAHAGWQGAHNQLDGGIAVPGTPHGGDIGSCERGGIGEYPGALIPARSAAAGGF